MWRLLVLSLVLVGCTPSDDVPDSTDAVTDTESRPDILLIVADDLGYSDIGAFGGEIATPHLDQLAANGVRLSNYHTGPTCSVSRAMLMTGVDSHVAGLGNMAETVADNQRGKPGYEGHLSEDVATIAEVLGEAGYHTYMAGKWHLGMQRSQAPGTRGFDQSFALLFGGASHFADMSGPDAHRDPAMYRDNDRLVDELPEDFYSTTYYTDRLIQQIDSNARDGKPFFAYLAYTAPHWPLQAPDAVLANYRGKYDLGYDAIREQRFDTQKQLGLFSSTVDAPPRPDGLGPWSDLDTDRQEFHARNMEIYAAMVDHMDASIGRLLAYLAELGRLDNTLIVFVSDNGAEQWNYDNAPPPVGKFAATFDNRPENVGRQGSFAFYGPEWAHVSNTPFTRFKGSTYEGGIRSPAIVHWPGRTQEGLISEALTYVTDWYATFTELAGASGSAGTGKSLVPLLNGSVAEVRRPDESVGVELWGRRGVLNGHYKLVSSAAKPNVRADWQLFNLAQDPAEQEDLAAREPEPSAAMQRAWQRYASDNNVILPDGPFTVHGPEERPTR